MAFIEIISCIFFIVLVEVPAGEQCDFSPGYGKEWMYFPDGDGVPHRVALDMPSGVVLRRAGTMSEQDITYQLYTSADEYTVLDHTGEPSSPFVAATLERLRTAPVKLITHGWLSSANASVVAEIRKAYLQAMDVIVITVDWSRFASSLLYPIVAYQTQAVGTHVGEFLDAMSKRYKVSGQQLHLIGHSLGAHVMGNAGHAGNIKVDRITGLDPARPLFEIPINSDKSTKLDASDAEFVDVIHTCAGLLGVEGKAGHADFYPNGGSASQPGCSFVKCLTGGCSHQRAYQYFAESIANPKAFPSHSCDSWKEFLAKKCKLQGYMGELADRKARGSLYLKTNTSIVSQIKESASD